MEKFRILTERLIVRIPDEKDINDFKAFICTHLKYEDIRFGFIKTDYNTPEVKVELLLRKSVE